MAKISRDEIKVRGLGRFKKSFGYSIDGLKYAYKNEQSMFIHLLTTCAVIIMNFILQISAFEWLVTFLAIGMVLSAELINTSIENTIEILINQIKHLDLKIVYLSQLISE